MIGFLGFIFGAPQAVRSSGGGGPTVSPSHIAVGAAGDTGAAPAYGTNAAGDLFVMEVAGRMTSLTTPAGWTLRGGPNDQAGRQCYMLTRDARSTGGESGTVAITAAGNSFLATIHTYRNVATSSFVESVATSGSASNGNGPLPPTVISSGPHRLAVFGCGDGNQISYPASITSTGGTWTRRAHAGTGTGSNSSYGIYDCDLVSAGTITGGDGGVGIDEHSCIGFALVGV